MDRRWFVVLGVAALVSLLIVTGAAMAATAAGTVKSVDAAKGTLVVTVEGKDVDVKTTDKTEVTIDGKAGKLADVKAGNKATVTHEGGTASKIAVTTK